MLGNQPVGRYSSGTGSHGVDTGHPHATNFDFVICNAVIQHIETEVVRTVVLPELARVPVPTEYCS